MQPQGTLKLISRGPELSVQSLEDFLFLGSGANGFPPSVQGERGQYAGHDHHALNQQTY
jgi:hypothetical protein